MSEYSHLTDLELLQLMKWDDWAAFDELYERYWLSLYNIAYKRLKDTETSKDLVQDVFADFWQKRGTSVIENLQPYLHTAIRYKIYTLLSKGHATAHFVEPFENMAYSPLTAESRFDEKELLRIVELFMLTLPEKRREIFRLRFIENISTREISQQLNISQKTVQNQSLFALQSLRTYMNNVLKLAIIVHFLSR